MGQRRIVLAARIARLVTRLNGCRVRPTAERLADELGVSVRTIKRDIAALNEAHVPMPPTVDQVEGL